MSDYEQHEPATSADLRAEQYERARSDPEFANQQGIVVPEEDRLPTGDLNNAWPPSPPEQPLEPDENSNPEPEDVDVLGSWPTDPYSDVGAVTDEDHSSEDSPPESKPDADAEVN